MKTRKATKKDVKEILKITRVSNLKYPLRQAKKEIEEMFSDSLIKPTYLVIEVKNKIVGCGGFSRSWTDMNIINIFWVNILPEYQGKKIGTKLVNEIIKQIENISEKPPIKMMIISTNKHGFWKKFGFKKLIRYYRDYVLMGRIKNAN